MKLSSCRYLVLVLDIVDPSCATQDVHWVKCRFERHSENDNKSCYEFISISAAAYMQLYAALRKARSTFNVTDARFHCVDSIPFADARSADFTDSVPVDLGTPFIDDALSLRVSFTERGAAV